MIWLPVVGKWADIDVYASIIAYADLLNQRAKPAQTYIPMKPNYSVPDPLRIKELENPTFDFKSTDEAIILDISIPEVIHQFVPNGQILELIDHHPGYEAYWQEHLGSKAIIEPIGAVATSIFEWWGECWSYDKMSPQIAKLLLAAILDNTLNFNAEITTERDRQAAQKLAKIINLELDEFTKWYFQAVSDEILTNLDESITNDIKMIQSPDSETDFAFGQLTMWDASNIAHKFSEISKIMGQSHKNWLVSILSISEKRNYILTNSNQLKSYFTSLLNLESKNHYSITNRLFLRKEIITKMISSTANKNPR